MFNNVINSQDITFIFQILLAVIFGSALGVQREWWGKWAGPRTYALVCAGSTLFTIISRFYFTSNPAMIVSAVVSGIGFLGAGTILHKENRVEGLTTAAGLWVAAAIGVTVGVEKYILAFITTIIILLLLMIDDRSLRK